MDYLTLARERFSADLYATEATGIVIEDARPGYARCSFEVEPRHKNAVGGIMGGALFTIADFAFAIASNLDSNPTVSLTSQISFHSAVKGSRVIAEAECVKAGRTTCYYTITITDDTGRHVATATITGYIQADK